VIPVEVHVVPDVAALDVVLGVGIAEIEV